MVDESADYVRALVQKPFNGGMSTPEDVRRILAEPLPSLFVDESHTGLLALGSSALPLVPRPATRSTATLESLLSTAVGWHVTSGTEEVWASAADVLTGHVWRTLSDLLGTFAFEDNRNSVDRSGATQERLRPDYCGWCDGKLVVKGEHKAAAEQLSVAVHELASKMPRWNAHIMAGIPFLPCYAVAGPIVQFAVVYCAPDGAARVETVTSTMVISSTSGRLRIVAASMNMMRIIVALGARMPAHVWPLYKAQPRHDGGSITVFPGHVVKRCLRPAPDDVYEALKGVPCAVRVTRYTKASATHQLAMLVIEPVAAQRLPHDLADLRRAVTAVLRALAAFHRLGFVHRDVRWPNVLVDGLGNWLLVDFELADAADTALPAESIALSTVAPEARLLGSPYTAVDDAWQVGRLMTTAGLPLSPEAASLSDQLLAPRGARLSCAAALAHSWLADT